METQCRAIPIAHFSIPQLRISILPSRRRAPSLPLSYLLTQWYITVGDFIHEFHVRVIEHDMEVLHGMDGLEGPPVLEPDDLPTYQLLTTDLKVTTLSLHVQKALSCKICD